MGCQTFIFWFLFYLKIFKAMNVKKWFKTFVYKNVELTKKKPTKQKMSRCIISRHPSHQSAHIKHSSLPQHPIDTCTHIRVGGRVGTRHYAFTDTHHGYALLGGTSSSQGRWPSETSPLGVPCPELEAWVKSSRAIKVGWFRSHDGLRVVESSVLVWKWKNKKFF